MGEDTQKTGTGEMGKKEKVKGKVAKGSSFCSVYYTPPFS